MAEEEHREYMNRFKKQLEDHRDYIKHDLQDHIVAYGVEEFEITRNLMQQLEAAEFLIKNMQTAEPAQY